MDEWQAAVGRGQLAGMMLGAANVGRSFPCFVPGSLGGRRRSRHSKCWPGTIGTSGGKAAQLAWRSERQKPITCEPFFNAPWNWLLINDEPNMLSYFVDVLLSVNVDNILSTYSRQKRHVCRTGIAGLLLDAFSTRQYSPRS